MRSAELDPQKVLRHALARAGIVIGYDHTCRRCKSLGKPAEAHTKHHADSARRRCEACEMTLWPKALPRQMRFHDLRHTTATLLLRAGVDAHRVQRIMRHSDVRLTTDTYGHLDVEDLRAAMATLVPVLDADAEVARKRAAASADSEAFSTRFLPEADSDKNEGRGPSDFSSETAAFYESGRQDSNLRPPGPEPGALPG